MSLDVLVVEDDDDICDTLALILASLGLSVARAADGDEALQVLAHGPPPRLVLLDLMMPRVSGSDVMARMRADPRLARVPVVVLSGDGAAPARAEAYEASACLLKPVELTDLLALLERFVGPVRPTEPSRG